MRCSAAVLPALFVLLFLVTQPAAAQTTKTWDGGGDGTSWSAPANWDPDGVPASSDDVVIALTPSENYTVQLASAQTVASLQLSSSRATLSLGADLTVTGDYTQSNGTLAGTGTLTVQGALTWSGGAMSDAGQTVARGTLQMTSSSAKTLDTRHLVVFEGAEAILSGYRFEGRNGAVLEIDDGAGLDVQSNNNYRVFYTADTATPPRIENAGTFRKSTGTTFPIAVDWDVANSGTIDLNQADATLRFEGALTDEGGTYRAAAGTIDLQLLEQTVTFGATSTIAGGGTVNFSGGTVTVLGTYDVAGHTEVSGASNQGADVTIEATANLLALGGALLKVHDRGTLRVETGEPLTVGRLEHGFQGALYPSSALTVQGDYVMENASARLESDHDVTVQGMMRWQGGYMSGAGTTYARGGARFTGGAGSASWNKGLDGRRFVIGEGTQALYEGTRSFTGSNGAAIEIQDDAALYIRSWADFNEASGSAVAPTIINDGTFVKSGDDETRVNWAFVNRDSIKSINDALILRGAITDENGVYHAGQTDASVQFAYEGTYSFGEGSTISGPGTIHFNRASTISIGGTYDVSGTSKFSGNGSAFRADVTFEDGMNLLSLGTTLDIGADFGSGGIARIETTAPLVVETLTLGGSGELHLTPDLTVTGSAALGNRGVLIDGPGDLTVQGLLNWKGGVIRGTGLTLARGGVQFTGGAGSASWNKTLDGRRLIIAEGTEATYAGTRSFSGGNGAVIEIQDGALFDIQSWADFNVFSASEAAPQIINNGTLQKSGGDSSTRVHFDIENSGILDVANDVLDVRAALSNAPAGVIQGTATLRLADASFTNEGTVAPGASAGTLTIAGPYDQGNGTLAIEWGGAEATSNDLLVVDGPTTLDGTLSLSALGGYDPPVGSSFEVVQASSVEGTFDAVDASALAGKSVAVDYGSDRVTVNVTTSVSEAPPLFLAAGPEQPGPDSTIVRQRTGTINFTHLNALVDGGGRIELNMFEDLSAVAQFERIRRWSATEFSWVGRLVDSPQEWVILNVDTQAQRLVASMSINAWPIKVEPLEDGVYSIAQIHTGLQLPEPEDFDFDDDGPPPPNPEAPLFEVNESSIRLLARNSNASKSRTAKSNHEAVVDMLVLYTPDALSDAGDLPTIQGDIFGAVEWTSQSFIDSGVDARVRLAGTVEVDPLQDIGEDSERGRRMRNHLRRALNDTGSSLYQLRQQAGADVVALVVDELDDMCGVAYIMKDPRSGFRKKAVFVLERSCMPGTFGHELGHVMGARHDWRVDKHILPYRYAHGYVNINDENATSGNIGWRTVMAYDNACDCRDEGLICPKLDNRATPGDPTCPRLGRWSDPDDTWTDGNPMGSDALGQPADNVRALNNTASIVAGFLDDPPIISGTITNANTGDPIEGIRVEGPNGVVDNTDANGNYEIAVIEDSNATITPQDGNFSFSPPSATFANVTSDQQQDFSAVPLSTVSGRVVLSATGSGLAGVKITADTGQDTTTNATGAYQFPIPHGDNRTITPSLFGYEFTPSAITFSTFNSNQTGQDFEAALKSHAVTITVLDVSGNPIEGVHLPGIPNVSSPPTTDDTGTYEVELEHGTQVTITPLKVGFTFDPPEWKATIRNDRQVTFTGTPGALPEGAWPLLGHDPQHRAAAEVPVVYSKRLQWSKTLDGTPTAPVVGGDGTIYLGTDASSGTLYALAPDGTERWTKSYSDAISYAPAVGTGGYVYVSAGDRLYGLNPLLPNEAWNIDVVGVTGHPTTPIIGPNGTVYLGEEGGLSDDLNAFPPDEDRELWSVEFDVQSAPAIYDGTLYAADFSQLHAFDAATGAVQWSQPFSAGAEITAGPTVAPDGTLYIGTDAGELFAVRPNGTAKWSQPFSTGGPAVTGFALGHDGTLYVGTDDGSGDGTVFAVDASGSEVWRYTPVGAVTAAPAISSHTTRYFNQTVRNEVLHVGSEDGHLYSLALGGSTARLEWQRDLGNPISTAPALTADGLYVATEDGTLHAFEPVDKTLVQVATLFHDTGLTPEEAHIIIWEAERGGPLGVIGGVPEGDPCEGGPLIIPNCPYVGGAFGDVSPYVSVLAGEELVIGVAQEDADLDGIIAGETTDGLLKTFRTTLPSDEATTLVIGGLAETAGYAENPDGRSTDLQLFTKTGLQQAAEGDPERPQVYAGHFSTDAPAMDITLRGPVETTFTDLRYGDLSATQSLPAGHYEATVNVRSENAWPVKSAKATKTFDLDLTGRRGEPIALLMGGFLDPDANQNGPALTLQATTESGLLPVELTRFEGAIDEGVARLSWETASETNNAGFAVERKAAEDADAWMQVGFVNGAGTTAEPRQYRFTDHDVPFTAETLVYRLKQIDTDGAFTYSPEVEVALGLPEQLALHPNFPNPFRDRTTIRYEVPAATRVRLDVYNVLGQRVATLVDRREEPGRKETFLDARPLASGLYFVRLVTDDQALTSRLTVVR